MNRKLDDYFESAKKLTDKQPPYQRKAILSILKDLPVTGNKSVFNNLRGPVAMSIILIFTVAFVLQFTSVMDSKQNEKIPVKHIVSSSVEKAFNKTTRIVPTVKGIKQREEIIKQNKESKEQTIEVSIEYNKSVNSEKELNIATAEKKTNNSIILNEEILQTSKIGEPVTGILELTLSQEEISKLGILTNDSTIEFIDESISVINIGEFNNDNNYTDDEGIYFKLKAGYPANGDTFLVKSRFILNLNEHYDAEKEKIRKSFQQDMHIVYKIITDTIDGKEIKHVKGIITKSENNALNGMTWYEYRLLVERSYGISISPIKYGGWSKDSYSGTTPIRISISYNNLENGYDYSNHSNPLQWKMSNSRDNALTESGLLPVKLSYGKDKFIKNVIFWFVPTDELIIKLPERYRENIKKEAKIINHIMNEGMSPEAACSEIKETSFFDICRLNSGAVTISGVAPQPVNDRTNIYFSLKEARNLSISLHDINGNNVGNIIECKNFKPGEYILPVVIKSNFLNNYFPSGFYLISIRSDKGETAVQRVIVDNK